MFRNRSDAGQRLAERLMHLAGTQPPVVVLGLPRGGVVVAAEIAVALHAPLDALVVRKLGSPHQSELAIGAVTEDGNGHPAVILNQDLIEVIGVDEAFLEMEIARQFAEVHRRQALYRRGRPAAPIEGRTVIVVDDGIATGATMKAGLVALRQRGIGALMVAVPVAARESLDEITPMVNEIVCLSSPMLFSAVGRFYADFDQTTDEEVIAILDQQTVNR